MQRLIVTEFCLIILMSVLVYGQQYPSIKYAHIKCLTTYDGSSKMYRYSYLVANSDSSNGNISHIEIDVSKYPNQVEFDTAGLNFEIDGFTESAFRRHYRALQGKIIPVGFPSEPKHWLALLSNDLTVTFAGYSPMIGPGNSLGDFVIMSKGQPGIRKFSTSPYFDPAKYLPDPDVYPDSAVNMDSLDRTLNYYGWTIGPTAPPIDFSASSWIDTLTSYKHQCVTLGWLTNGSVHEKDEDDDKADEGIVERLDRRLDKAKAALAKSDSVKARLELELFVKEVEQLYHKNKEEGERRGVPVLTSEGYALLKYNAQYLIDRLPEKHGRGDEGERRGKK